MNKTVFISYNSRDSVLSKAISDSFDKEGIQNWFAEKEIEPGHHYAEDITPAIAGCSIFLLIASKYSIGSSKEQIKGSPEVAKEIQIASNNRRTIIPIKIDNALEEGYDDGCTYHLGTAQWLDVSRDVFERKVEITTSQIKKFLENDNIDSQSFISSMAINEQIENIKQIEIALKKADTAKAQQILLANKFAKQYDNQIMLLKIITSMIKNNLRNLQSASVDKLLSQLDTLMYTDYEHYALYLKAMLSISFFKANGIFDKTGGFDSLYKRAEALPPVSAKYILMSRHIQNSENIELKWKHFL